MARDGEKMMESVMGSTFELFSYHFSIFSMGNSRKKGGRRPEMERCGKFAHKLWTFQWGNIRFETIGHGLVEDLILFV